MRKKGSKQSKVSRIDRSKALAAQADEAIKERIRTAPAYMYTSLCPVPELRRPPKGVIWYYETVLHRQRASRVRWPAQQQGQDTVRVLGVSTSGCRRR